jgi:hypothetical protein
VGLTVRPDGNVYVRVPLWLPERTVRELIQKKIPWIKERQKALEQQVIFPVAGPVLKEIRSKAIHRFGLLAAPWEAKFREQYGVYPLKWTVRDMTSRWGSCSMKTRRITLNLKLFHKPDECVEYVIVHELCHLIHPDHGKGFYALLEKELPDWKARRKKLKM